MSAWIKKHDLIIYFILAFAISWTFMIPPALATRGLISYDMPYAVYYLASFGPMISALLLSAITGGASGIGRLLSGLLKWRVGWGYFAFSVFAPFAFFFIAVLLTRIFTGAWPQLSLLGEADYLPYLGFFGALGLWLLTYGMGEEVGWRGYALPRLQRTRSAVAAALILGVIWASWHLPAFFFRDTYIEMGALGFPIFIVSVVFASVLLTWLYNSTAGSLLMVVLFHALYNWLSVSEAGGPYVAILMGAAAVTWAVRVLRVYGTENLSPEKKVTV